MSGTTSAVDRLAAVDAAFEELDGIREVLYQLQSADLGPALRRIDDLSRRVEAARVAVVAEAMDRGDMQSDTVPMSDLDRIDSGDDDDQGAGEAVVPGVVGAGWVEAWAPSLRPGGAQKLVRLCEDFRTSPCPTVVAQHAGVLREAVLAGRVGVSNAAVVVAEVDRLIPRL